MQWIERVGLTLGILGLACAFMFFSVDLLEPWKNTPLLKEIVGWFYFLLAMAGFIVGAYVWIKSKD